MLCWFSSQKIGNNYFPVAYVTKSHFMSKRVQVYVVIVIISSSFFYSKICFPCSIITIGLIEIFAIINWINSMTNIGCVIGNFLLWFVTVVLIVLGKDFIIKRFYYLIFHFCSEFFAFPPIIFEHDLINFLVISIYYVQCILQFVWMYHYFSKHHF